MAVSLSLSTHLTSAIRIRFYTAALAMLGSMLDSLARNLGWGLLLLLVVVVRRAESARRSDCLGSSILTTCEMVMTHEH